MAMMLVYKKLTRKKGICILDKSKMSKQVAYLSSLACNSSNPLSQLSILDDKIIFQPLQWNCTGVEMVMKW